ncbi:MAG: porin family protein [Chlorobi bacterium]|nr:porin family protein [Chlorobiota bacterium]
MAQIENENGVITLYDGQAYPGHVFYYGSKSDMVILYDSTEKKIEFFPGQIDYINLESGRKFVSRHYLDIQDSTWFILQSLIESDNISLYMLNNEENKNYFFVQKNDVLYKLENNETIITVDQKKYKKNDNKYIGVLHILMEDRPEFKKQINQTKYSYKGLSKLIIEYNNGNISYFWDPKIKTGNNWIAIAQYSHYGTYYGQATVSASFGTGFGLQQYFKDYGGSWFKYALFYSEYYLDTEDMVFYNLALTYGFDFVKTRTFLMYGSFHILDIGYVEISYTNTASEDNKFTLAPRFSPGIGFEYRPISRFSVYTEINNLMQFKYIPNSFSFGLKYDFGKNAW